jgi:DNA-nicking Smr family endonuclease
MGPRRVEWEEMDEPEGPPEIDLHGLRPEDALRRLSSALVAARLRRATELVVVTGKGLGNLRQEPILRTKVEAWLAGPDGARHGVVGVAREAHGGALRARLRG